MQDRIANPVRRIKLEYRDIAGSVWTHDPNHRIEGHQNRSGVIRGRGNAAACSLNHVTNGAILLQAKTERLAPKIGLVVIDAARIEAEVPAQRPHLPQLRTRNLGGCLGQAGQVTADARVACNLSQGTHRADRQDIPFEADPIQSCDRAEAHQVRGGEQPVLHIRNQVRSAREYLDLTRIAGKKRHRFFKRSGSVVLERRQRQHRASLTSCAPAAAATGSGARFSRSFLRTVWG